MTDMGVTIEDTLNKVIAECVWGYIKEGTNLHTRGPNEWTLVSTEPSSNPPNFENIKLYTFGDYLDNHTKLSKADKRKYKFSFTSKGSIGESFEKYYQSLYDAMKPTKDIITSANENNLSFLSNGFYQIVPSFFKLLVELEQKKVEYSIVFRTFGEDTPKIAEELNLFCEGKHPICSKLDEFKQMNGNNYTIDRRLHLPQFNGKVLRNDDDVTFVTVNNNNIIEAYDGYDEFNRILFEWTKNGKTASIQDDYHYWASHAEDDHSGKLLILQKEDSKIKQLSTGIFFKFRKN
jgi:hypothetical protein